MGGGAFTLLKVGRPGPESAKQAEIRLAILPKILHIARFRKAKIRSRKAEMHMLMVVWAGISAGYG